MGGQGDHEEPSSEVVEQQTAEYRDDDGGQGVRKRGTREPDGIANGAENNERDGEREGEGTSVERVFEGKPVPSWREQLTFRAFVVSIFLGILFSVIVMRLILTTGIIPSFSVSAGLLGFCFVKLWTTAMGKSGLLRQPFTRQENTVIQTCVVATSGIANSGGFGTFLFGMSEKIANQTAEANAQQNIKNPQLGWMIGFLFVVSFLGLFSLVPLRKIMIIDYKLIYPSGTATAHLINSFHTPQGATLAKKQVKLLGKCFTFSFLWGFFQWFYTATEECGFINFPSLGLKAFKNRFYFDFSATYVGVGMICPYLVNLSALFGSIISWGLMWPLIKKREGDWFVKGLGDSSLHGINGYRVFIATALILGDGLYNFVKVMHRTITVFIQQLRKKHSTLPISEDGQTINTPVLSFDDERRMEFFLKDQIPKPLAFGGYVAIAAVSIATLPHIFTPLKWYYILVAYIFVPVLAFCNAYGCGLTDLSLASTYGQLAIFTVGAWAGSTNGGVLAGLAACGVMINVVSTAADLMQDFRTGYLTLASPRSMFVSQVIGTAMGCVISPCVFWFFYKAFPLGTLESEYPAPYALVSRNMAILGAEGFGSLPKNCLTLCFVFFAVAIIINFQRDILDKRIARFVPIPMAMAVPFFLGPYFAIDMCVGSLILYVWERTDKAKADTFGPVVASGLICGDGIWALPQSFLSLAKVKPPICMKFLSRQTNEKVDAFLSSLKQL